MGPLLFPKGTVNEKNQQQELSVLRFCYSQAIITLLFTNCISFFIIIRSASE